MTHVGARVQPHYPGIQAPTSSLTGSDGNLNNLAGSPVKARTQGGPHLRSYLGRSSDSFHAFRWLDAVHMALAGLGLIPR